MNVNFDRGADVMYLSVGTSMPDEGEDRPRGIVLRYSQSDDKPFGVTVIGYVGLGWSREVDHLAQLVAKHLSVDPEVVLKSIINADLS